MNDHGMSARIKTMLPFLFVAVIYLLIAGVTFHFLSKGGTNLYLSIAGGLLWPLVLLVFVFVTYS